jgi:enamidase
VWLAKAGFGAFKTAFEYAPLVAAARAHGMITTCHTGGSSIPGSGAITGDHLLAMKPHVSFHVNGGPTAMPDQDFERIIVEGDMACRSAPRATCAPRFCARRSPGAQAHSIVSSWRPTRRPAAASCRSACSTPCRISRASAGIAPELCIAAATGSNARVYGLESGRIAAGKAADIVLLDAPDGGTQDNALAAIKNGDIAAVGAVITGGRPRFVGRSRNTPATTRTIRVASCKLPQDFSGVPH